MTMLQPIFTLDCISSLISTPEISPNDLVEALSDLESDAITTPKTPEAVELLSTYYSSYILALLLADDINEARFLSHRINTYIFEPNKPASTYPLLPPSITLLKSIYTRNYPTIYKSLLTTPWGPVVQPLASRLLSQLRLKTFKLLSYAYTSITPEIAARYLGYESEPVQSIVERLVAEGWSWNDGQGLLVPTEREELEDEIAGADGTARAGLGALAGHHIAPNGNDGRIARLTGLVTHLTENS